MLYIHERVFLCSHFLPFHDNLLWQASLIYPLPSTSRVSSCPTIFVLSAFSCLPPPVLTSVVMFRLDHQPASSIDNFARLRIRTHGGTSTPANAGGASSDLELSRPGAAVLASISKSGSMSKAAGALALSHLAVFRPADAGTTLFFGMWLSPLFPIACFRNFLLFVMSHPQRVLY